MNFDSGHDSGSYKMYKELKLQNKVLSLIVGLLTVLSIASIIIGSVALKKIVNDNNNILPYIDDIRSVLNTTVYSYPNIDAPCFGTNSPPIIGATVQPGYCTTATGSYNLGIKRLASNCNIYVYEGDICNGTSSVSILGNETFSSCDVGSSHNTLGSLAFGYFNSFQVLCH